MGYLSRARRGRVHTALQSGHFEGGEETAWSPRRTWKDNIIIGIKETLRKCMYRSLNSVVLVRKRTIPTKRPQPADEVSANFS
jgi:hypothetical protein